MEDKEMVIKYTSLFEEIKEYYIALDRIEQLAKLKEVSKELAVFETQIADQRRELQELASCITNYEDRTALTDELLKELDQKRKKYVELLNDLNANENKKKILQDTVAIYQKIMVGDKSFDKRQLFQNIRSLANSKNVKLGQIERNAGCQPGYMSRLEKADNLTDPSVGFIITAAKDLEVPIDLLIFGKLSGLSSTEQYILRFISQLTKDTMNDEQCWVKENFMEFSAKVYRGGRAEAPFHPVFHCDFDPYEETYSFSYDSSFFPGKALEPVENCYYGELKGSDARIYIIRCKERAEVSSPSDAFFEVYLTRRDRVNPVFCTAQICKELVDATNILYKEIEDASTHVHINEETKNIIDLYFDPPV